MKNMVDQSNMQRIRRFLTRLPLGAAFLLTGCFGGTKQSTVDPHSDSAQIIHDLYVLVTWIDVGIFIAVFLPLIYALWRFRDRGTGEIPKQVHGNLYLEMIWTVVPIVLLLFIAIPTWQGIFRAYQPPTENAYKIQAIGHQWWWEFKYPDGTTVTANEMHVPVNTPIVVETFSKDVIHSFWVPKLAGKVDTLPGKANTVWFKPVNTGLYYGQCAEFCGTSHANMRFRVIVDTPSDFQTWLKRQQHPPLANSKATRRGQQLFAEKGCVACHTIQGLPGAVGVIGPNLNALKDRTSLASGMFENTREKLISWLQDPQKIKPGALMVLPIPVNAEEAGQLADFLLSEPTEVMMMDKAAEKSAMSTKKETKTTAAQTTAAAPDRAKGKQVYMTICVACHGPDPTKDGALGPAISGSSLELIQARVLYGNVEYDKSYPPGYTPKRNTRIMTPFSQYKDDVVHITEFLKGK